ncbi:TyeA family type III secretion system gatekeeper subunit [Luteococcus sp.]|uniref:TyeA family type III secretion system gatekeeper subunit n=1 Tax=Luteococcus sp. TaxID=1969402 RepID=UPI003734F46D
MSDQQEADAQVMPVTASMALLRRRKLEATQALLGDTISITDEQWHEPSRLTGWTRAHVATHLARNADGLRRVVHGLLTHVPTTMYPDERTRRRELEAGSRRGALELQIDLDTSTGDLNETFDYLQQAGIADDVEVRPGVWMPAHHLVVARLNEVVLHRIDLDHGFTAGQLEADIARWLLEWNCQRIARRQDFPALQVSSTSGFTARIGPKDADAPLVRGSDAHLLGWLTSRASADEVHGAESLELPEL